MNKKNLKTSFSFSENNTFTGEISGYTHQGLGVTRYQNKVVFVPYALKGEIIEILPIAEKKNIVYGQIAKICKQSPHRTTPACDLTKTCGGCALQHADYTEQLNIKTEIIQNALERLGKQKNIQDKIKPIISMTEPYHYRNKGVFRSTLKNGKLSLGFLEENTHKVVDHRCTLLFPAEINNLLNNLEKLINQQFISLQKCLSGVVIRTSFYEKKSSLILLINNPKSKTKKLAVKTENAIKEFYKSLQTTTNSLKIFGYSIDNGEVNPLYTNLKILSREQVLTEQLGNIKYEISPESFFQVNPIQTEKMLNYIKSLLPENKILRIIDAYSGIGTIGLALAEKAKTVDFIEIIPKAVKNTEKNCQINQIKNANCYCGKAENLFKTVSNNHAQTDHQVVIIDPPRKGCQPQLLQSILDFSPEQIIYVSCNPATLARDLAYLTPNYYLESVQPLDMFPQSYHVENIVSMSKK